MPVRTPRAAPITWIGNNAIVVTRPLACSEQNVHQMYLTLEHREGRLLYSQIGVSLVLRASDTASDTASNECYPALISQANLTDGRKRASRVPPTVDHRSHP